jgi:ParB family transcriptional regulator, chromosome partitioning protein
VRGSEILDRGAVSMAAMELEFHQLELRYQSLRRRAPEREKRLLASLAQHGQQAPIVVVAAERGVHVVVDGYKRVRALKVLKADTVQAIAWELPEAEALLLERLMRSAEGDGPFEQAWLLRELHERFSLSHDELARRFDKSQSWVSRRLALVEELPGSLQEQVRSGQIVAHAAMKYLVPMARANCADAVRLVAGLGGRRPSSRQMGALYGAWLHGGGKSRELLLSAPWTFLKAQEELQRAKVEPSAAQQLLGDLGALGGIARRVGKRLREGAGRELAAAEREEIRRCFSQAKADAAALFALGDQEL